MTIKDRVMGLVRGGCNLEKDSVDKLVVMAYWIGREQAAREVSDRYAEHLAQQSERAAACRYRKMAEGILCNGNGYLYSSDYGQEMTTMFGSDETTL